MSTKYYIKNREKILARVKLWAQNNRERSNEIKRKWEKNNPKKDYLSKRESALKIQYGITLLEYDRMYQIQGGRCAICKVHQSNYDITFHVDHNHKTGKVRGLLCFSCNFRVGRIEADRCDFHTDWIKHAKIYLDKSNGQ